MPRQNVEVVRRAFEAFNRRDLDAAVADIAPDFEYVATGAIPGAGGVHRGPEGFRRFLEGFWSEFGDPRIEIHEIIEAGDHVLVSQTLRGRGKKSGAEVSWHVWQVGRVRDDKLVRGQGFTSRDETLKAVTRANRSSGSPRREAVAATQRGPRRADAASASRRNHSGRPLSKAIV